MTNIEFYSNRKIMSCGEKKCKFSFVVAARGSAKAFSAQKQRGDNRDK